MRLRNLYAAIAVSVLANVFNGVAIDRASAVVLNFEGLQDGEGVLNFYNGGTGSNGSTGTNYGASFTTGANNSGGTAQIVNVAGPNFSNPPSPSTVLFFQGNQSNNNVLNVSDGFTSAFSFAYGSRANQTSNISIYDGLNGSGSLLGSLNFNRNNNGSSIDIWNSASILFSGTARSVIFDVTANQVAFDNINLNLVSATAVPEPFTVIGTIVGGTAVLRLRKTLKKSNED